MRPDYEHGTHAAHVNDRLPWWLVAALACLAVGGTIAVARRLAEALPGWML